MRRLAIVLAAIALAAILAGCAYIDPKIRAWIHEYDYGYRDYAFPVQMESPQRGDLARSLGEAPAVAAAPAEPSVQPAPTRRPVSLFPF